MKLLHLVHPAKSLLPSRNYRKDFLPLEKRKSDINSYEDGRPTADHSEPANKIPTETRKEIINICNKPEYASMAPCEIVPTLADEGIYIASESTFYRVLREEKC